MESLPSAILWHVPSRMCNRIRLSLVTLVAAASLLSVSALAQANRIPARIDNARRVTLRGHLHPEATAQNDEGPVDGALVLSRVTLMLAPSTAQHGALQQLLARQQDPASSDYHHWLTPEQYAGRFGVSQDDMNRVARWLESQHLPVIATARGRNWIAVRGAAADFETAFATRIHRYRVNGELHFANATEPTIPAALAHVVQSIRGLHDFRSKPRMRLASARPELSRPGFVSSYGTVFVGPDDLATIYNVQPLYTSGITGSGQKLAVVGQVELNLDDIRSYRSFFNLPPNDPQIILVPGTNPGNVSDDREESDLDLEMSGGIAPDANILFVDSDDVDVSLTYAIDQNLAPVISMSYGRCEAQSLPSDVSSTQSLAQQANAQGITWLAASGDSGAADCSPGTTSSRWNAVLSTDLPASLPEVTGVGGNTFNEGTGNYWAEANNANGGDALGYVPETAWNNGPLKGPAASGGGASSYFLKPAWQNGMNVPLDNARDVPDVAFNASNEHDVALIFSGGSSLGIGGTSAAAPLMAALVTLLNQYVVAQGLQSGPGLGNINPQLYSIVQTAPTAFHDITTGNNIISVTCSAQQRGCQSSSIGYSAGAGYDQVTGWGSLDAHAFFTAWANQTGPNGQGPPALSVLGNAAAFDQQYAPGMLLTMYGSRLSPETQSATSAPWPLQMQGVSVTINNITAPLYYVSPGQLSVQIPYETPVNISVTLTVRNNGSTVSTSFVAAAAAPGIFTDVNNAAVPYTTAARGETITLYLTGAGAVAPAIADGAGPRIDAAEASLPRPQQTVGVVVGGVTGSSVSAVIPPGYVGVTQVTYQVPATAPLGPQPVVVTLGSVSSAPATLIVTP